MSSLLIGIILILFAKTPDIESFEGSVKMTQESCYETFHYTYFIKENNVRIDKFDEDKILVKSIILNLKDADAFVLSPNNKLYSKITKRPAPVSNSSDLTILKTENSKLINNALCYQWRVKNTEDNTEIAFWVSQNNLYFFSDLIRLLVGIDNSFMYFDKVPDSEGFFPMLTVERTLLRKEKRRLFVVEIKEEKVDENIFVIPAEYKLLETIP